ncbi:hypothetical protein ACHQM5_024218 [Ranunculus cassubicifolius]
MEDEEERSLFETPTWAVATVITVMVTLGFLVQGSLQFFAKWLLSTKRKPLLAALHKIKEELMLFGLLSLLMGHWTILISKICVKSSVLSTRFYPCALEGVAAAIHRNTFLLQTSPNHTQGTIKFHHHCPQGREPLASYESLEQLHRLLFVLGVVHVSYNFTTIALAMLKLYSWRSWETQARLMVIQELQGSSRVGMKNLRRLSTFVFHHTSHPWSRNRVLVWMLCFSRQFWSSINRADYMALRLGFLTSHELHPTYDFHSYMLRSMEDEFRDIVGISVPLWIYAILCIFLDFHEANMYFWLSFIPAILILLVGTKLHHIVIKLALEVTEENSSAEFQFNLRDELFWFGRPKLLLWLIQLISFQNAFEMATFIWSLWEIKGPSCFMENRVFLVIRLTSGVMFQFWCSYITFPLYVIVTQMGSKFKKSVVAESVRESLHGWRKRAKRSRQGPPSGISLTRETSVTSLDEMSNTLAPSQDAQRCIVGGSFSQPPPPAAVTEIFEHSSSSSSSDDDDDEEDVYTPHSTVPLYNNYRG